jgi:hypothetical protein
MNTHRYLRTLSAVILNTAILAHPHAKLSGFFSISFLLTNFEGERKRGREKRREGRKEEESAHNTETGRAKKKRTKTNQLHDRQKQPV